MRDRRPGAYARAVEQALAGVRGRPGVLSPRDWARVADWCARGIPLPLVLEALEEVGSRMRRRGGEVRSLALVAPGVEESWSAVQRGRPGLPVEVPEAPDAASAWRRLRERRSEEDALARWLEQADARLRAGSAADELEEELDALLPDLAGDARAARVRADVDRALAPFRARMTEDVFTATRRRALRDGLRRALGLPPRGA
ncbi:MAG TPA: hypothetical protein VFV75_14185 [Candidatus Polarisedimenticolaceae bacterium]|nr:hypothetical protein [Candidatus Polarisedimenticolaceae bacterium]